MNNKKNMTSINRLNSSVIIEHTNTVQKKSVTNSIEDIKQIEVITPVKEDLKINNSLGNSDNKIDFVENDATFKDNKISTKEALKQFDNQVQNILTKQNISPENAKVINEKISDLTSFLNTNKLDNNEKINQLKGKLNNSLVALKISGVDTTTLNNHITQLMFSVTEQVSKDSKLNLNLVNKQDHILGIENNSKNLTNSQKQTISALKDVTLSTESIKVQSSGQINKSTLILMSIRDELLRQSFERLNLSENEKEPNIVEKDLNIISNMVSSVDKMMAGTKTLPPNMLEGLSNLTKTISSAPLGDIDKALQDFSNSLANTNSKVASIGQLSNLPNSPDTTGLKDLNKQLLSLTQYTPTGVGSNVQSVIGAYSNAMNTVESMLPPVLPFPVTMNVPLGYNDGAGNIFALSVGSQVSQNGTGFQINSPSLLLQSGGTQVLAGQTSIQLGNQLDYLSMGSLSINSNNTKTNLTNATMQINRVDGSSVIKADSAIVNTTNGKIELTNAGFYQNSDGSLKLSADSFWSQNGADHTGMKNFQINQSETTQKANFNISATSIDFKKTDMVLSANKISFDLEKDNITGSSQALLSGENIKFLSGGNDISATNAQFKLLQNADGSALTEITAQNPNIILNNGSNLNVKGNTKLSILQGTNGELKNISTKADEVNFQDKLNTAKVIDGNLNINYDSNGNLSDFSATATSVDLKNKDYQINAQNTNVLLNYQNDKLSSITGSADKLDYTSKQGSLNLTNGLVNSQFNPNGSISNITANVDSLNYKNQQGMTNISKGELKAQFNENGTISSLSGKIDTLSYKNQQGNMNLSQGNITTQFNSDGTLASIKGGADKLSYFSNKGDKLDLKGAGVEIINGKNGLEKATATVGQLNYLSKSGDALNLENGKASISRDPQGFISNINAGADKLTYSSKNGDNLIAQGTEININGNKNGLSEASIKIGQLDYNNLKGDSFNVVNGSASLTKDSNGFLSQIAGSADKISATNKSGDAINILGANADITRNDAGTYDINASLDKLNVDMKSQDLTIGVDKLKVGLTDTNFKVHVDSVEIIKKLESDMKVKIENLDFIIDKTKEGALKGADLQFQNLDASIKGMEIMVKTQNGDRIRLNMSMSEDGKMLKEAFLQIPKGGEVKIAKDDMNVTIGEQLVKFTQKDGVYTLRDDGLNIAAQFKDGKVQVQGGSAQLSIDTNSGNLLIDEIKGTKINAEFGKNKIDIDIKEVSNFMLKTSGLSGDVQGLTLELVPTKDSSKISMSLKADIGGTPVRVELTDVHHLKASADIGINRAHVFFGDASGRGNVLLSAGPVKMEGSSIEFLAKYNTYNPERMMSSVSRYMSNEGIQIGALTLETDGVIRLEKQSSGLHLGASLLMPKGLDNYDFASGQNRSERESTWGAILSVGGQGRSDDGTKYTGALYGGLVPGSYFSVKQLQGTTSVYNAQLPKNIELPTTIMAGAMFRSENEKSRVSATIGGYVNPVGLVPTDSAIPLRDNTMYGAFAGVSYKKGDLQFNLDALADVNKNADSGKTQISPMVRAGLSMQF